MRIVVLRCGDAVPSVAAHRGEFFGWIKGAVGDAGVDWLEIDARTQAPSSADAFIITGSAASVTERAPWMVRTEEFLREASHANVPILGICFGHQMLGQALGGHVEKNPRGREIGTVRLSLEDNARLDPIFGALPQNFPINMTHVDTVAALPEGAHVLARTALEPRAAFRIEGRRTWGVQFHPEIDGDAMRGYIRAREGLIRGEGLPFEEIHESAIDTPHGPTLLQAFVRFAIAG
jgi:GMP synthase (glutamine-hydrolysing)